MHVSIIETSSLGDRSYLVSDDGIAVVIDPQRDIDHSVGRLADELPDETPVYPTHGFGSFCSATRRAATRPRSATSALQTRR